MESRKIGAFKRALCAVLSLSLIATLGIPSWGYADSTGAVSSDTLEAREPLTMDAVGEEEAQAAAEERATDVAELGYVPGELVVVYDEAATDAQVENALESIEGEETSEQVELEIGAMATVEISDDLTVETAAEIIEADPAVKYAVPNYVAESYESSQAELMGLVTNVTSTTVEKYANQWHLDYIKAPEAWTTLANSGKSLEKIRVAIIDTGASLSHSDLQHVVVQNGESIELVYPNANNSDYCEPRALLGDGYTNGNAEPNDLSSHGTHVSGIVAAEANNGGVLGVASGGSTTIANKMVELVVIDAFSLYVKQGSSYAASATLNDILYALNYAADHGCTVVNMSLGFPATDENLNALLDSLTTDLAKKKVVIVAAAGNGGDNTPSVPAMCTSVLAVTNVNKYSNRGNKSSYGTWCDIAAPGEDILSTLHYKDGSGVFRDGYGTMSGTSMASPVVAGVAAMVRSVNPSLSSQQVRNILCATATPLSSSLEMGSGVVNAKAAVDSALSLLQTSTVPASQSIQLMSSDVTLSASSLAYKGYAQKPSVTVKYQGKTLTAGTHYTVTYGTPSSTALGTYFITVEGKGSYWGKITKRYTIAAANLSGAQITAIPSQRYTGRALTPIVTVKQNGRTLTKGADYTVTYSNNVKVGIGYATIKGTGNYTGTRQVSFSILQASTVTTKPSATTTTKPTPGWYRSGSTWKYVYSNGTYARGWASIGGTWYYFNNSSNMVTGWQRINGTWYYFLSSGAMATGWAKIGGTWYYLYSSGAMATGWARIGGTWYYLYSSGAMATGWVKVGSSWYYLYSSGAMASNTWIGNYYLTSSGAMATNTWIGRYHVNGSGLWDATR